MPIKLRQFWKWEYDDSAYDGAYAFVIQADDKCVVYTRDLRMNGKKAKVTWCFLKHAAAGTGRNHDEPN